MKFEKPVHNSPLYQKKLSFDGDSICAGAGYAGGYAGIIGEHFNAFVENIAVGGGTVTAEQYNTLGVARHWICRTVSEISLDADYIILDGGVNDASLGVEFGTVTSGFDAELDDTTFCGAMESVCKQLVTTFAGKKVGFILVHKMTPKYSTEYAGEDNYYKAEKAICEKWGVPYLDLNTLCPPLEAITALREIYTKDADGWHPNELGYKTYYVPKIICWLESL